MRIIINILKIVGLYFLVTLLFGVPVVAFGEVFPEWRDSRSGQLIQLSVMLISTFGLMTYLIMRNVVKAEKPFEELGMTRGIDSRQVMYVLGIAVLGIPLSLFLADLFKLIELPETMQWLLPKDDDDSMVDGLLFKVNSMLDFLMNMLVVAFVPAVCEEMFFRGLVQGQLRRKCGVHIAIWLTALCFAVVHGNFYTLLNITVFGAMAGYVYHYTKSLSASMLLHLTNNGLLVVFAYVAHLTGLEDTPDPNIHMLDYWYLVIVAAVGILVMMRQLRQRMCNFE